MYESCQNMQSVQVYTFFVIKIDFETDIEKQLQHVCYTTRTLLKGKEFHDVINAHQVRK